MKHGSLFSGIGGFDLAAEWMGWENVFHCEWNEFGQKVLKHHFPKAISYHDITKTDFTIHRGQVDVLTGGFPCQPFSMAGKRKGTDDERYLWHEMLRAVQEIEPAYVIAENVFGITNIDGGLVFEQVCLDLEAEGYEVQPFIIPAAAKNAPHRRDRVWFVAYSKHNRHKTNRRKDEEARGVSREHRKKMGSWQLDRANLSRPEMERNATDTNCNGLNQCNCNDEINASKEGFDALCNINESDVNGNATNTKNVRRKDALENGELEGGRSRFGNKSYTWDSFPSQSPICGGDDGLPTELDGITFSKWRAESIKAYGNAIVPQVAYEIFKAMTL